MRATSPWESYVWRRVPWGCGGSRDVAAKRLAGLWLYVANSAHPAIVEESMKFLFLHGSPKMMTKALVGTLTNLRSGYGQVVGPPFLRF